jgi:hypothetical protein
MLYYNNNNNNNIWIFIKKYYNNIYMTGYIYNNNISINSKTPIYIRLLHTTGDICNDKYELFIDSTNILDGDLEQKEYTFTLLISATLSINHIMVPVFDKPYEIYIKLFDMNEYENTIVLNTDDKVLIGDNIYKLTYTFTNNKYNYSQLMCNIRGYINDSFNILNSDKIAYDDYIINANIK